MHERAHIRNFLFFFFLVQISFAQTELEFKGLDKGGDAWREILVQTNAEPELSLEKRVQNSLPEIWSLGYFQASFEIQSSENLTLVKLRGGEAFNFPYHFLIPAESQAQLKEIGLNKKPPKNVSPLTFQSYSERILNQADAQGYPFAELKIELRADTLELGLNLGRRWMIDSLIVKGEHEYPDWMVGRMMGIQPGTYYKGKEITRSNQALNSNPYVKVLNENQALFTPEGVWVYTYIDQVKLNRFDGLIGLASESDGKLIFTGNLKVSLKNNLARNEEFFFSWTGNGTGNQNLKTGIDYPFILRSPVGFDGEFELIRQDSSFLREAYELGISYQFGAQSEISFKRDFYRASTLNLENPDKVEQVAYALGFAFRNFDRPILPRKGSLLEVSIGAGNRNRNDEDLGGSFLWDLKAQKFFSSSPKHVFIAEIQSAGLGGEEIQENEFLQTGGLRGFRGSRENEIQTAQYAMARIEYRYFWDVESFFFTSIDRMNFPADLSSGITSGSLGIGIPAGNNIFSMAYGLAKPDGQAFFLDRGLIHLAFIGDL